ncbi:MAG: lactate racemase domain-containing protein [Terracidiphilus sp.]
MNAIPRMIEVRQNYPPPQQLDLRAVVAERFLQSGVYRRMKPGMRIAVGAGSRGISNLDTIVKAMLEVLKNAGAKPFIVPAMGSHGGATPEGQTKVLAGYGVTAETMGVPVEASMEVRKIGTAFGGRDVVFSAAALDADAVVAINRIKPHTDFHGNFGSGIQKMLAVGFGKQIGANLAHRAAAHEGYEATFREYARIVLSAVPVLCGVAIVEDQRHETAVIEILLRDAIVGGEARLIEQARALMPRLPLDEIDFLIVDEMGKEISGTGMDTNVIGRDIMCYSASLRENGHAPRLPGTPLIHRIFVRGLSAATKGNGVGLGLADFTTTRLVKALDLRATYVNALTSLGLMTPKIPIHFDTDREAIEQGLATLAADDAAKLRVVRIANTLRLDRLLVSESCAEPLSRRQDVRLYGPAEEMRFDAAGNLVPF